MTDLVTDFKGEVDTAVSTMWPRYRRYVAREDVTQALWVWLVQNKATAVELEPRWLQRRLRTAADRYCRREKAQRAGYDISDEYFYSILKLRRVIVDAFDSEAVPPSDSYRADELYAEWITEVADVRAALRKRTFPLRHYLTLREYAEGRRGDGEDEEVKRALWALQRMLGGSRRPK